MYLPWIVSGRARPARPSIRLKCYNGRFLPYLIVKPEVHCILFLFRFIGLDASEPVRYQPVFGHVNSALYRGRNQFFGPTGNGSVLK
jgi:hypothetical protein